MNIYEYEAIAIKYWRSLDHLREHPVPQFTQCGDIKGRFHCVPINHSNLICTEVYWVASILDALELL